MKESLTLKLTPTETTVELFIGREHAKCPHIASYLKKLANKFVIITDETVEKLYGNALKEYLGAEIIAIPAGEKSKTREMKQKIEDKMFEMHCGRDTCVIALGGGMVTDIAGFVAATYCRGVPFVSIPTTLLAMVDASIGGKTGVNLPHAKNYIGATYQPKSIFIDLDFLEKLPKREMTNGMAEIIKYGLIKSPTLFETLEAKKGKLEDLIKKSCQIKLDVVKEDVNEGGLRRILNFGHTIGHAIEALEDYQVSHGEAIALGMIGESYIAHKLGSIDEEAFARIKAIFKLYDFPLTLSAKFDVNEAITLMKQDKKALSSKIRFALIDKIGSMQTFGGQYCAEIDDSLLQETLQMMKQEFTHG